MASASSSRVPPIRRYTLTLNGDLFAAVQGTPATGTGSVTGVVFSDSNTDGIQNTGEVGVAGLTVFIDTNGTGQYTQGDPTASTNSNGTYTFVGLAPEPTLCTWNPAMDSPRPLLQATQV